MLRMNFGVGVPDISNLTIDADNLYACGNSYADVDGADCNSVSEYEWDLPNASDWDYDEDRNTCIDDEYVEIEYYENPPASSEIIRVRAINTCGASNWISTTVDVDGYCGGYYMSFTPNPTSGETTLSIESESTEKTFDENTEWELEIYSPTQTLKEKRTKLKGNSTTIQTQSWKEGVYVVRVKYKGEILTGKLVVKK